MLTAKKMNRLFCVSFVVSGILYASSAYATSFLIRNKSSEWATVCLYKGNDSSLALEQHSYKIKPDGKSIRVKCSTNQCKINVTKSTKNGSKVCSSTGVKKTKSPQLVCKQRHIGDGGLYLQNAKKEGWSCPD